ncbi:DUF6660 family protein [uncultured Flavobacterium sp.]|uniref:DUF6660 family protein n=1 Tax=uncultured Flavobacterium sp. TaxID=165435 RepID=UPI0025E61DF4|nr:DUF6660 family protein [uncultured Flavobacterium sp.]
MKQARHFLTAFLSAYLLILMVLPCNDAHAQTKDVSQTQFPQVSQAEHHEDFCTPFCICSCCTTPIIVQSMTVFEVSYFENHFSKTSSFYKSIISNFYGSIWQPPQLV